MSSLWRRIKRWPFWTDSEGQDLIEYALMAGFVAVAAGAAFPPVASSLSSIYSKVTSVMTAAGG